jgi:hypothetical protein
VEHLADVRQADAELGQPLEFEWRQLDREGLSHG